MIKMARRAPRKVEGGRRKNKYMEHSRAGAQAVDLEDSYIQG